MITHAQAEALVDTVEYRDWSIRVVRPDMFGSVSDMMRVASVMAQGKVPVEISYVAPDSEDETRHVHNDLFISVPRTGTEAEFARALYEAIARIEEHERREFFRIADGRIDGQTVEKRSRAIFHPHGIKRNAMFHDLDKFAEDVRLEALADGEEMTADAV